MTLCLFFVSIWYVGLTCAMFKRDGVEIPCPDSIAGLYIKTRTDQIVKVNFLVFDILLMQNAIYDNELHLIVHFNIFFILLEAPAFVLDSILAVRNVGSLTPILFSNLIFQSSGLKPSRLTLEVWFIFASHEIKQR